LRGGVWRQADVAPEKFACIIAIASLGDAPSLLIWTIASVWMFLILWYVGTIVERIVALLISISC
jgi:hypothetical protein